MNFERRLEMLRISRFRSSIGPAARCALRRSAIALMPRVQFQAFSSICMIGHPRPDAALLM